MEKESLFNGKLLVDSRYLDRDDNGYLYYKGKPFSGLAGFFRKDGTLSSYIEYTNSIPHGKGEAWYESGQKRDERYYEEGCVVGIRKEWYESGLLKKELHVKNLRTFMEKEWDESGNSIKEEYNSQV